MSTFTAVQYSGATFVVALTLLALIPPMGHEPEWIKTANSFKYIKDVRLRPAAFFLKGISLVLAVVAWAVYGLRYWNFLTTCAVPETGGSTDVDAKNCAQARADANYDYLVVTGLLVAYMITFKGLNWTATFIDLMQKSNGIPGYERWLITVHEIVNLGLVIAIISYVGMYFQNSGSDWKYFISAFVIVAVLVICEIFLHAYWLYNLGRQVKAEYPRQTQVPT